MMAPIIINIPADEDDLEPSDNGTVTADIIPDAQPDNVCPICGQVGKSPRGVKAHMTRAHGTGDKEPTSAAGRKAKRPLEDDLGSMLAALAMAVSMFDQYDALILAQNGPPVARAWSNLAMRNPAVDRMLRSMMGGVSYGEVIVATAMMVMPILAHHRILPQSMADMLAPMDRSNVDAESN
jgi:hypothetical protein